MLFYTKWIEACRLINKVRELKTLGDLGEVFLEVFQNGTVWVCVTDVT
jgi:hypothetical protein